MKFKNQRTAFATTFFPISPDITRDFLDSLEKQTHTDFELVILNDNFGDLSHYREKYPTLKIIDLKFSSTPSKNREYLFNYLIESGYTYAVFGDSDDYFKKNRIETALYHLKEYDIVVNDISLFEESHVYKEKYISNRIRNGQTIQISDLLEKNFLGLSNTAIRLKRQKKLEFEEDLIALDWYFFTQKLLDGERAIFTNESTTYYRQYQGNQVGLGKVTESYIKKLLDIKKIHYGLLKKKNIEFERLYDKNIKNMQDFKKNNHIELAIEIFCKEEKFPLWWEFEFQG